MKRIGIISDTHGTWDDRYSLHFNDCDEIWHAGDIGDPTIIERLKNLAHVRAVSGNIDHGSLRRNLNELEIFEIEKIKVLLTHIGGYPKRWSPGIKQIIKENRIKLIVDGHSHILRIIYDPELDILNINPGAAGLHGWQQVRTLVKLTLDNGDMRDCEVIELGTDSKR